MAIKQPIIDWSGNCGNLSATVGPFPVSEGLLGVSSNGVATVRIWQANIGKKITAHVPMYRGEEQELGDFELDGVTFPGTEVKLEFIDPASENSETAQGALFPNGHPIETPFTCRAWGH